MLPDNSTTQQTPAYSPPQIQVEPNRLSFGAYNPNLPLIQQPTIRLTVRNVGGSMLTGRLVPQVSWLIVNPQLFKLKAGESGQHVVQISTGAPQQVNRDQHFLANALVITSNAGPTGLDVSYTLDFNRKPYTPLQMDLTPRNRGNFAHKVLPFLAVGLFLLLAFFGMRFMLEPSPPPGLASISREELLTQGAQTIMASSGLITDTPEPEAAIVRQATATSMSLFEPLTTDTPDLTKTAFLPTFTPWPTDQFVSPEVIVNRYFEELIIGNYQAAWNFLTRAYQEECCTALGTDPYYIFSRDWSAVTEIKLVSAYLQEYALNPAPVLVRYQYRNAEDELQEFTHMYWVVVNEDQTGLLISAVDPLQDN